MLRVPPGLLMRRSAARCALRHARLMLMLRAAADADVD